MTDLRDNQLSSESFPRNSVTYARIFTIQETTTATLRASTIMVLKQTIKLWNSVHIELCCMQHQADDVELMDQLQ